MSRLCRFCISFGFDWGNEKRPTIEQTPCWIEVQLPRQFFKIYLVTISLIFENNKYIKLSNFFGIFIEFNFFSARRLLDNLLKKPEIAYNFVFNLKNGNPENGNNIFKKMTVDANINGNLMLPTIHSTPTTSCTMA